MQRDLVEQAMAGDRDAFTELARVSIGRLYAIARLILRDDGRAEDATQEALVAAWRRLSGLRDPDRFEPGSIACWSTRAIARHAAADGEKHRGPCRPAGDAGSAGERSAWTSTWPFAINSSAASDASTWTSGRCSSCITTSGSASTTRRTSSVSHRGPSVRASIGRRRDAKRPRGRRPSPFSTKDGRHDVARSCDDFDRLMSLDGSRRPRPRARGARRSLSNRDGHAPTPSLAPPRMVDSDATHHAVPGRSPPGTGSPPGLVLLALVAIAIVGSTPRLPKPFGLAANGRVAYLSNGQIYAANPNGSNPMPADIRRSVGGDTRVVSRRDQVRVHAHQPEARDGQPDAVRRHRRRQRRRFEPDHDRSRHRGSSPTVWSPDGRWLVYSKVVGPGDQIFIAAADGTQPADPGRRSRHGQLVSDVFPSTAARSCTSAGTATWRSWTGTVRTTGH